MLQLTTPCKEIRQNINKKVYITKTNYGMCIEFPLHASCSFASIFKFEANLFSLHVLGVSSSMDHVWPLVEKFIEKF